jgi:Zn-dependent protease with chaperone function
MNFFEHQDAARRKTGTLVVLFLVAVVLIVLSVNVVVAIVFGVWSVAQTRDELQYMTRVDAPPPGTPTAPSPLIFLYVSIGTLTVIALGTIYKTAELSRGGSAVARMLGGRPLAPDPTDPDEIKLRNIVEEMSIASGLPVPSIFVMDNERGINAFAAGFSSQDAVVGVTRGCIDKLNRDELQGVIAHEFSHILNGDMRLNLRLIGILHGILLIGMIGYALLRSTFYTRHSSSRRSRDGGGGVVIAILVLGGALLAIGYIGVFFGRLIQAAVSRQREYLADAAAVQFTRNPSGIAGALKKIGGYSYGARVDAGSAMEVSHMFFGSALGRSFSGMLATHPPLVARIKAIEPGFDGRFPHVRETAQQPGNAETSKPREPASVVASLAPGQRVATAAPPPIPYGPQQIANEVGHPQPAHLLYAARLLQSLPTQLSRAAHDPFGAQVLVYCLLLSDRAPVRIRQMHHLRQQPDPAIHHEAQPLAPIVDALGPQARLPLLDMALPALRRLGEAQIRQFKQTVTALIHADQQVSPFEFALHKILQRQVMPLHHKPRPPAIRYHALSPVLSEALVLASTLARAGKEDDASAQQAFAAAARQLGRNDATLASADLNALDRALERLAGASPQIKRRVLEALASAAAADDMIQLEEAELLRAIAASLDCPIPPILQPQGND